MAVNEEPNSTQIWAMPPVVKPETDVDLVDVPQRRNGSYYLVKASENLLATSRTAHGTIDTGASTTKAAAMEIGGGEQVVDLARENFVGAISLAYENKNRLFSDPNELRVFVEQVASLINRGIVKEGMLVRGGEDSVKYPHTRIADLPAAMEGFYDKFYAKISDPSTDPIETAAFAEYNIDLSGHFFADGCGKTAKAISAFVLMRSDYPLPTYRGGRDAYYAHAPRRIAGVDSEIDQVEYDNFVNYYKTLFEK